MTVSANVPMPGSYDLLQVALSVFLPVPASCSAADLAPRLFSPRLFSPILIYLFVCMDCRRLASERASHRREVVC